MARKDSLLIFLIGIIVFTIGLGPEFLGLDARFGLFAQEMLRNGPTFFPTTYGQPYPDYPAGPTFLSYLASLPFGKVTPFTAILPTAIISALILVVIYRIGALHSRQWGLFAVLLTLFTIKFFTLSRSISTDQYTSLATALCFYLVYSADLLKKQKRLWFVPLLFAASFTFRGPIGLVIPAAVVCAYYLYNRQFKRFFVMAVVAAVLFAVCGLGLLAAAKYQGGEALVKQVIKMQAAGRLQEVSRHNPAYYWIASFTEYFLVYPLAVIVAFALFKKIFRRENADYKLLACLVVWILVVLIGMSVPSTKKIRYVLPMIPAAALVSAYLFIEPMQKLLCGMKNIFLGFCSWFPLVAIIGVFAFWIINTHHFPTFEANYITALILLFLLAIAGRRLGAKVLEDIDRQVALMAVGAVTFIVLMVYIAAPISYAGDCTGPFVQKVERLQQRQSGEIVFYHINPDGEAIKFMVNLDKPIKPQFTKNPNDLLAFKSPAYFIAMKKDFDAIPPEISQKLKIADHGTISRDDAVVFTLAD